MRTTLSSKSKMFAALAIAGLGLLSASPAFALSVGGYAGKTWPTGNANEGCMQEFHGGVVSKCGNQTQYEIPLAVNQGLHVATVATFNPGGGTFQCFAYAEDNQGNLTQGTSVFPGTGFTAFQVSVTVPAQGSMYVFCNVNPNGQIVNVNYAQ